MLKLFFVIFANFHRAPYIVPKMRYMADIRRNIQKRRDMI